MTVKSKQKIWGLEQVENLEVSEPDKASSDTGTGVRNRWSKTPRGFGGLLASLERSDGFQQRLSTFNSEIERQLKIEDIQKGV